MIVNYTFAHEHLSRQKINEKKKIDLKINEIQAHDNYIV